VQSKTRYLWAALVVVVLVLVVPVGAQYVGPTVQLVFPNAGGSAVSVSASNPLPVTSSAPLASVSPVPYPAVA
jgi:hypothetical protein